MALALTNQTGGLYGRILTECVSTDQTQWGLYTRPRSTFPNTDRLSSVNKMFITWQEQEQFNSLNETGLHEMTFLLANDDDNNELKMNYLPPAVFIAQLLVGSSKQLKQIIQTEHNILTY